MPENARGAEKNDQSFFHLAGAFHIPDTSSLHGFALIGVVLFGAVRGFALLTGFEASVAGLSHEYEKPRWARIAMGIGTVMMVFAFTSVVTFDIANTTRILELQLKHNEKRQGVEGRPAFYGGFRRVVRKRWSIRSIYISAGIRHRLSPFFKKIMRSQLPGKSQSGCVNILSEVLSQIHHFLTPRIWTFGAH